MLLKNVMWDMFQDTGRIEAYLFYRNCEEEHETDEFKNEMNGKEFSQKLEH